MAHIELSNNVATGYTVIVRSQLYLLNGDFMHALVIANFIMEEYTREMCVRFSKISGWLLWERYSNVRESNPMQATGTLWQ